MKLTGFNPDDYEEVNNDFEPLPNGIYKACIVDCEDKESKAKDNCLNVKVRICGGKYDGRILFHWLNMECSKNEKAEKIAAATLASIFRAVNIMNPTDTDQIIDKMVKVELAFKPASGEYGAGNKIVKWINVDVETKEPAAEAEADKKRPWETEK